MAVRGKRRHGRGLVAEQSGPFSSKCRVLRQALATAQRGGRQGRRELNAMKTWPTSTSNAGAAGRWGGPVAPGTTKVPNLQTNVRGDR